MVMTDLFENVGEHDALLSALKHLRHKHHEVVLFHILEKNAVNGTWTFRTADIFLRIWRPVRKWM